MALLRRVPCIASTVALLSATMLVAQKPELRDRGPGIPTSMFGIYVERGELLLYPFAEWYFDGNAEYKPAELGYGLEQDFRGRYRAIEGLLFLAYGFSDRLALEVEAAVISAQLDRSPADPSGVPPRISESGLGDVESELRWRWARETPAKPEVFSYFETVFPLQKNRKLIGTSNWEFKLGSGVIRGFGWGTVTLRAALEYDGAEHKVAPGEYAFEYLRRLSPHWRIYAGVEGADDEVELIMEAQWLLRPNLILKMNNAFGLSSKATDWAPELGLMFSFR